MKVEKQISQFAKFEISSGIFLSYGTTDNWWQKNFYEVIRHGKKWIADVTINLLKNISDKFHVYSLQ